MIHTRQPLAGGLTALHFEVDDTEAVVRDLTSRGVTFEEYETPKTVNVVAQFGPVRGAWFKDPPATCGACARGRYLPPARVAASGAPELPAREPVVHGVPPAGRGSGVRSPRRPETEEDDG